MSRRRIGLILTGALTSAGCDQAADSLFCAANSDCEWSAQEWESLSSLAGLPEKPPADASNSYIGNPSVEELGRKLFHDTRLSGPSNQVDVLRRPVPYARAPKGSPTNLACVSCHNLGRAGIDTESQPGNVSIGAAWADTNALPLYNAAYYGIVYWNGQVDSLWAQVMNSLEGTNMNGNRLRTAWTVAELYRADHDAVFKYKVPMTSTRAQVEALIETSGPRAGQCKLNPGCPTGCRAVTDSDTGAPGCFPRFPLEGKPGSKKGCQPGSTTEPWGDAFDCMDEADQKAVIWVMVDVAKSIASFEFKLVSRDSAFDRYIDGMREGTPRDYTTFSAAAERGARVFIGRGACNECHQTPLFSDSKFHNIGVPQVGPGVPTEADCPAGNPVCDCVTAAADHIGNDCFPWGAADGLYRLKRNVWRRDLEWSDDTSDITRKYWVTMAMDQVPRGVFRTPSLRNVALTAPYMHNGSLHSLEEVIEHYDQGGSADASGARSAQVKPLLLSADEKADLLAFLRSLSGAPLPTELVAPPDLPRWTTVPTWPY